MAVFSCPGEWEIDFSLLEVRARRRFELFALRAGRLASPHSGQDAYDFWLGEVKARAYRDAAFSWYRERCAAGDHIPVESVNTLFTAHMKHRAKPIDVSEISANLCLDREIQAELARQQNRRDGAAPKINSSSEEGSILDFLGKSIFEGICPVGDPIHRAWKLASARGAEEYARFQSERAGQAILNYTQALEFVIAGFTKRFDITATHLALLIVGSFEGAAEHARLMSGYADQMLQVAMEKCPAAIRRDDFVSELRTRLVARLEHYKAESLKRAIAIETAVYEAEKNQKMLGAAPETSASCAKRLHRDPIDCDSTLTVVHSELPIEAEHRVKPGGKRGPATDFETALTVAAIVREISGDGPWPPRVDLICTELDDRGVTRPKTWRGRGHRGWLDCYSAERHLVVKAIRHHLTVAKKTIS